MKKIDLDFTSLLDIMLILLFAFILNSNGENAKAKADLQDQLSKAQAQVALMEEQKQNFESQISQLKEDLQVVSSDLENLQKSQADYRKNTLELNEELKKILHNPQITLQTWHNYQAMAKRFLVVEVSIVSPNNQLVINGKPQPIYISLEELADDAIKNAKQKELEDSIERTIDSSHRSGNMILISIGKDIKIPRLVYNSLWDSIKNLEARYGKEKLFKTEFYLSQ